MAHGLNLCCHVKSTQMKFWPNNYRFKVQVIFLYSALVDE